MVSIEIILTITPALTKMTPIAVSQDRKICLLLNHCQSNQTTPSSYLKDVKHPIPMLPHVYWSNLRDKAKVIIVTQLNL